ncbi:SDR family NAD(P)-dependent oxidoreductase [Bradyrhizobium tropiciagri]|uniref:SDR family NAD(P)-dependent oxidoreductase n=1 Tax=Bradyrhizobium tropiciagri TaxID=312253 RepID=UPI00067BC752|nr:SDR family oxidoreductase [Bradyrhizobium tropiciagri]
MIQGAIIVSGASRGIGAAVALELARRGFTVGCVSRSGAVPASDTPISDDVRARLAARPCDVTDMPRFRAVIAEVAELAGGLGGLINNAGVHKDVRAQDMSIEDFEWVMRMNTTAVLAACQAAYPLMLANKRGLIVNIGSFFERLGVGGSVAYCASKAAVAAVSRCLAAEWSRKGISVLNVAPGYVETDINRDFLRDEAASAAVRTRSFIRRAGNASEVARLIAALYVEDIPFLTGETIVVDGGYGIGI